MHSDSFITTTCMYVYNMDTPHTMYIAIHCNIITIIIIMGYIGTLVKQSRKCLHVNNDGVNQKFI